MKAKTKMAVEADDQGVQIHFKNRVISVPWPAKEKKNLAKELNRLEKQEINLLLYGTTKP